MKSFIKVILFNIIVIVVIFFFLEGFFRLYNVAVGKPVSIINDSTFGWVPILRDTEMKTSNKCGEKLISAPVDDSFIRKRPLYPNAQTTVLFIGDSYTHAEQVSAGSAYYDIFEKEGKGRYRVFAAAVGGYGTLQEYMILQKVYDEIKPDIVIWQMCANDVDNNVYELDNSSFFNNQRPRPYLNTKTDIVTIKNPGVFLFEVSQGFNYVFSRVLAFDRKYNWGFLAFLNSLIALDPQENKFYTEQGITIVKMVLEKAKKEYPQIQFIGFSVNKQYDNEFNLQFNDVGMNYLSNFSDYMETQGKINCLPLDAHWNYHGHKVAGKYIFSLLQNAATNQLVKTND